jgi:hypothetical protein
MLTRSTFSLIQFPISPGSNSFSLADEAVTRRRYSFPARSLGRTNVEGGKPNDREVTLQLQHHAKAAFRSRWKQRHPRLVCPAYQHPSHSLRWVNDVPLRRSRAGYCGKILSPAGEE